MGNLEKNFCDTYANKGWSSIRYALNFKHQIGSLLDYAIKKERLLLESREFIDTGILIDLIASGLPNFVADRINRESLKQTEDLYNEIGKLEHMVNKKNFESKKSVKNSEGKEKQEKKPCKNCEKIGYTNRYHPESSCWFKDKEKIVEGKKSHINLNNNSEIEAELNDTNEKN